jgi:hypothetical protein
LSDNHHLALRLPPFCPQCLAPGGVELQRVIKGGSVLLCWACTRCDAEWPIDAGEPRFVERRTGRPDRRKAPRTNRRKV